MNRLYTSIRRKLAGACHAAARCIDVNEHQIAIAFSPDASRRDLYKSFCVYSLDDIPQSFWEEFHEAALKGKDNFSQPAIYLSHVEINSQQQDGFVTYSLHYENRHSVFYEYYGAHIRGNDFVAEEYESRLDGSDLGSVKTALSRVLCLLQTSSPAPYELAAA